MKIWSPHNRAAIHFSASPLERVDSNLLLLISLLLSIIYPCYWFYSTSSCNTMLPYNDGSVVWETSPFALWHYYCFLTHFLWVCVSPLKTVGASPDSKWCSLFSSQKTLSHLYVSIQTKMPLLMIWTMELDKYLYQCRLVYTFMHQTHLSSDAKLSLIFSCLVNLMIRNPHFMYVRVFQLIFLMYMYTCFLFCDKWVFHLVLPFLRSSLCLCHI